MFEEITYAFMVNETIRVRKMMMSLIENNDREWGKHTNGIFLNGLSFSNNIQKVGRSIKGRELYLDYPETHPFLIKEANIFWEIYSTYQKHYTKIKQTLIMLYSVCQSKAQFKKLIPVEIAQLMPKIASYPIEDDKPIPVLTAIQQKQYDEVLELIQMYYGLRLINS